MFSSGGPKQYPYLARFLDQDQKRKLANYEKVAFRWGPIALGFGILTTSLIINLRDVTTIGFVGAGALLVALGSVAIRTWRTTPKALPSPLEIEAQKTKDILHLSLFQKRLNLDTPASVATLLEEASRHWTRIDAALRAPEWNAPQLPDHYIRAREQARAAADQAMNEIVLTLAPTILSDFRPPDWRDTADTVIDKVFRPANIPPGSRPFGQELVIGIFETIAKRPLGAKDGPESPQLPSEFYPAQQLTEKLRDLVIEVEATKAGVGSLGQATPRATSTLDSALGELRSIREAETELQENLRNGA